MPPIDRGWTLYTRVYHPFTYFVYIQSQERERYEVFQPEVDALVSVYFTSNCHINPLYCVSAYSASNCHINPLYPTCPFNTFCSTGLVL